MSARTVLKRADPPLVWIDMVQPTAAELDEIAKTYGLQPTSVNDCLDPEHLPKFEQFESYTFVIIRAFDERSERTCATVQELTRKVAIFSGQSFLITIHRTEQGWLSGIEAKFEADQAGRHGKEGLQAFILTQVLNGAIDTYLPLLEAIEGRIDAFEELVFGTGEADSRAFTEDLRDIHLLKRQVTLIKRLLWRMLDVVQRMTPASGRTASLFRDVQENVESYHFYADELLDDANTILNVQLALAAHRTGEVMRILTVFSVFFLPLTFLVGVYGMNFDFMPELRSPWGYPVVLAVMGGITLAIYLWFRRRGWLRE
ncbi:MAG TPA: CorA family divalent cation transporter [Gemmatimonadales bacterium]|nr:CorA family divalent cation transporter [Gemmatimonadales bacterium]